VAKTAEFWGQLHCLPTESVDLYYDHFHELLDDLQDADDPISSKSAIRQFIFTLGPDFEPIQNNFRVKVLPAEWYTEDWPTILSLCHDFHNLIKPQGLLHKDKDSPSDLNADWVAYQKKIRDWWLNPTKFCQLIETEQAKHPEKCLYHLTKSHQTSSCAVKKECNRILASKQSHGPTNQSKSVSGTTGQLRHTTEVSEDVLEEQVDESVDACLTEDYSNDTNEEILHYFSRVTNHYLRLIKSTPTSVSRYNIQFPIIADSGANCHMFRDCVFFDTLEPASGQVILGDGKTSLPIKGIGTVSLCFGNNTVSVPNVRFVPDLAESIYSLFCHIQCPQHELHSSYVDGLHIGFPGFQTKAIVGEHDIYLDASPTTSAGDTIHHSSTIEASSISICRAMNQTEQDIILEPTEQNYLMLQLRQYYNEIKKKRQLNFEVPAGFHRASVLQRNIKDYVASQSSSDPLDTSLLSELQPSPMENDINPSTNTVPDPSPLPDISLTSRVPIL